MKFLKSVFILLFLTSFSFGQDLVLPSVSTPVTSKEDTKDLVWNRYTTENFTILSIDNNQGKRLYDNIENYKYLCLKRWGIPNFKFPKECRIMVVPSKDLLKKLFNISESRCEVRVIKDELNIVLVWMVIESDKDFNNSVPYFVTTCSLVELNFKYKLKNNLALINGMSLLNESLDNIKNIKNENIKIETKILNLLSADENIYKKMNDDEKKNFKIKSLILCLMLKKEFGENKFLRFLLSDKPKKDLIESVYKFKINNFEKSYDTYTKDFLKELKENKVPDRYIDIKKN
jgi:hypothetical protein